jgi:hypothetical protein
MLTYERGKANPHTFALDDLDHKMVDYLLMISASGIAITTFSPMFCKHT